MEVRMPISTISSRRKRSEHGIIASDIMVNRVYTARPEQRVYEVVQILLKRRISGMPVIDDDRRVIGIISEKDCITALMRAVHDRMPPSLVRDVMSTDVTTIHDQMHLMTIAHIFLTKPVRRLPVVNESGQLLGQVSRRDLLSGATQIFQQSPSRETALLYLSALDRNAPS